MKKAVTLSKCVIKTILFNMIFGVLTFLICILITSFLFYKYELSESIINIILYITIATGCLIAAYVPAYKLKEKGILYGCMCGSIIAVTFLIVNTACSGFVSVNTMFTKLLLIMCFSIIGGIIGVNKKSKRIKY